MTDQVLLPVSVIGGYDAWALGAGADKVSAVLTADDATSYIEYVGVGAGQVEMYEWENISTYAPAGSTITNLHCLCRSKCDSTIVRLRFNFKSGTSFATGTTNLLQTIFWANYTNDYPLSLFTGLAWTMSEIDGLGAGILVWDTNNKTRKVTQLELTVSYTLPPAGGPTPLIDGGMIKGGMVGGRLIQ